MTLRTTTLLLALALSATAIPASDARQAGADRAGCAAISDPDPMDCPFCGGNPQVHIKAYWAIQKEIARAARYVLL